MSRQTVIMSIVCVVSLAWAIGFAGEKPNDQPQQSKTIEQYHKTIEIYAMVNLDGDAEIQINDGGKTTFQAPRITLNLTNEKQLVRMHVLSETGPTKETTYGGFKLRKSKQFVIHVPANQD